MKRLLLLSLLLVSFAAGYGQPGQTKQVKRFPVDSATVKSSIKKRDAQVIDGSQNVQARSGGQSTHLYAPKNGQQRLLSQSATKNSAIAIPNN